MKQNHPLAMEYIARLLRVRLITTVRLSPTRLMRGCEEMQQTNFNPSCQVMTSADSDRPYRTPARAFGISKNARIRGLVPCGGTL